MSTLVKGIGWQGASAVVLALSNVSYMIVMARLVTPEHFGVFAICALTTSLIYVVSELGLGSSLIQASEIDGSNVKFCMSFSLLVGFGFYVAILLFVTTVKLVEDRWFWYFFACGVWLPIQAISNIFKSLLIRQFRFGGLFAVEALGYTLGTASAGVGLALLGLEEWALILAQVLGAITSVLLGGFIYFAQPLVSGGSADNKGLIVYGVRLTGLRAINQAAMNSDRIVVSTVFSLGDFGIYDRYTRLIQVVEGTISKISDSVMFSSLSRINDDLEMQARQFQAYSKLLTVLCLIIAVNLFAFSEQWILFVLGDQWVQHSSAFEIMSLFIVVGAFSRAADTLVRARGAMHRVYKIKVGFALVSVLLTGLAAGLGLEAVAIGLLLAKVGHSVVMYRFAASILERKRSAMFAEIKGLLAALIVATVVNTAFAFNLEQSFLLLCTALAISSIAVGAVAAFSDLILDYHERTSLKKTVSGRFGFPKYSDEWN